MSLLIKNARIIAGHYPGSPTEIVDILISKGIIEQMGKIEPVSGTEVWDLAGACVSPGWVDVGIQTGDPGFEHREDLLSVAAAAAQGGFTRVACFPNTFPITDSKSSVLYIKNKTEQLAVTFHPIGALSQNCEGKDLAELYDMHQAGAIAFSDGSKSIQDAGLLLRALQYSKAFNGLVFNKPYHKSIASGGQMHEGIVSTSLGLKGIPALAEELMVQRDLSLAAYAENRLHFHLISTKKSVEMIRAAKKSGLPVTASAAVANLCFTDQNLSEFDSNWKVLPPLRSEEDRKALQKGLEDGTIDFICSNHTPLDVELKNLEFTYADFGMIGLETAFAVAHTYLGKKLNINELVYKLSAAPRKVLGLPVPEIKVGERAELTLFNPDETWVFTEKNIRSKSANTPFIGEKFTGKVLGIINGEKMVRANS